VHLVEVMMLLLQKVSSLLVKYLIQKKKYQLLKKLALK